MTRATKRALLDIADLQKSPLDDIGIYINISETNVLNLKALIIGRKGTPYYNGFYIFDIIIPPEYPFKPPKVTFCTQSPYAKIRFNPNLYADGKVCLSILNTWAGPGWAPTDSIRSVLLILQAIVMHENPMKNEPGFENSGKAVWDAYNSVVLHENYHISVCNMLLYPRSNFKCFHNIIKKYFIDNIEIYRNEILENHSKYSNKPLKTAYNMEIIPKYDTLYTTIEELYEMFTIKGDCDKLSIAADCDKASIAADCDKLSIKGDCDKASTKGDCDKLSIKGDCDKLSIKGDCDGQPDNIDWGSSQLEIVDDIAELLISNDVDEAKYDDNEILQSDIKNISMKNLLHEFQTLAKKLNIEICKQSEKSHKLLKKTKHELFVEIKHVAHAEGLSLPALI